MELPTESDKTTNETTPAETTAAETTPAQTTTNETTPAESETEREPDQAESRSDDQKQLYPAVAMYGPYTVSGLKKGEVKSWCTCGLSKKQPWCDGSHRGTGFKPLQWTVPHDQSKYQICACKYTKSKPLCDATHTNLPCLVLARQDRCQHQAMCDSNNKLCTDCGYVPDF